jgi:DnaK suppressor protein
MSAETKVHPPSTLSQAQINAFADSLRTLHRRYAGGVESLASAARVPEDASVSPSHLGDVGSDVCEQDIYINLLEGRQEVLREIGLALARVAKGTYGMCEGCGEEIAIARLEALPHASLCVPCQLLAENPR